MQTSVFRAGVAALAVFLLVACSDAPNPYAHLPNAPLMQAQLHTITFVTDDGSLARTLAEHGYAPLNLQSNYPGAARVEAMLWDVPEEVAARPLHFAAPASGGPAIRILQGALPRPLTPAEPAVERDFYRSVLGTEAPRWPDAVPHADNVRLQAWTYLVPNIVEARRKLREAGIQRQLDAVAITTAYLGDHKTMSIRAPDGTVIELVEGAAR